MELSKEAIESEIYHAMISCTPRTAKQGAKGAAETIWSSIAKYIEETENRILDADFAKYEAEQRYSAKTTS